VRRVTPNLLWSLLAASAAVVALALLPAAASAANPPACDTNVYPVPFLIIDGKSVVIRNTRYLKMRQNGHASEGLHHEGTPEHPFPLKVVKSNGGGTHNFTVNDYARDEFPISFARHQTADATATYVEDHIEYTIVLGLVVSTKVRCTRTVTAHFNRPKVTGGGGHPHHEDDGEPPNPKKV
jgi:hypothetical protein